MVRGVRNLSALLVFCVACSSDGGGVEMPDAGPDAEVAPDYCAMAPDAFQAPPPATTYNGAFPLFAVNYPPENPYTWEKAILGKILFWEEQLSSDDTMACGTCHRPGAGGSDPRIGRDGAPTFPSAIGGLHGAAGVRACEIVDGEVVYTSSGGVQVTKRKPPSYLDAMFAADLFWDGRATTQFVDPDTGQVAIAAGGGLESQAVGPPVASVEMACADRSWSDIHAKLETAWPLALARDIPPDMLFALCANPSYPELFEAAFGTPEITTRRIAFAIATHERTLISNQTPYDRYQDGDPSAMTQAQVDGMLLVAGAGKCQRCHVPPLWANGQFVNLGFIDYDHPSGEVGTDEPHVDLGREELTGVVEDRGKFRTATMRNVGLREPQGILHDGVLHGADLDVLMDAYNIPPGLDAHTDPRMNPAEPTNLLGLGDEQIAMILDFMRNALTDPRVAAETYPFDRPTLGSE
jgi:cytochrome c peroxidase